MRILITCFFFCSKIVTIILKYILLINITLHWQKLKILMCYLIINHFLINSSEHRRRVWKTCGNIKKRWLYKRELFRIFVPSKIFKLISIDLSRHTDTSIPQQTIFKGKLEEDNGATMFFSLKSNKIIFETFLQIH